MDRNVARPINCRAHLKSADQVSSNRSRCNPRHCGTLHNCNHSSLPGYDIP